MSNGNPCCVSDFTPWLLGNAETVIPQHLSQTEFRCAAGSAAHATCCSCRIRKPRNGISPLTFKAMESDRGPNSEADHSIAAIACRHPNLPFHAPPNATDRPGPQDGPADGHDDDRTPTRRGRERGLQRRRNYCLCQDAWALAMAPVACSNTEVSMRVDQGWGQLQAAAILRRTGSRPAN
jgi:hypothetical protein